MKMFAIRLQQGADLKESIETFVRDKKIGATTVISAVGSLERVRIRMAGAQPDKQDIRDYQQALEIVSLIGNVGQARTHLHIAVSDAEGRVIGGHLKDGSIVHTTVELVFAVEDGLEFREEIDPITGFGELSIVTL